MKMKKKLLTLKLQVKGCMEDNSIFFNFSMKTYCDPSLEPSRRDGSNDGSQNMFLWRNKPHCPFTLKTTLVSPKRQIKVKETTNI